MNPIAQQLRGIFLMTTGSGGAFIALLKPWQEHIEWGMRMALLLASLASVILGLWVALRKKPGPPAP